MMVLENFSPFSLSCLNSYLQNYNLHDHEDSCLSWQDAWLLASVWLARTLRWSLRMHVNDEGRSIAQRAIQSAQFILAQLKECE